MASSDKKKSIIEATLVVELANQSIQSIVAHSSLSNEIVKAIMTKEDKTDDDFDNALSQLQKLNDATHSNLRQKITLLKELNN